MTRATSSRAGRRVDGGAPQLGDQQIAAAEHVKQQSSSSRNSRGRTPSPARRARIIRHIEVENDLLGGALTGLQEQADQEIFDRYWIVTDLVIARVLEPVSKVLESAESVVILSLAAESIIGGCHVDQGSAHPACAA